MTNEEAIFAEALRKALAEDRSAFLDEACAGNDSLRKAVDALLLAHDRPRGVLESPPVACAATSEAPPAELVGATVGPYKLLEQIGGGGMGVVYMAEQLRPVRRKVALKIIKPGMDSRQVIARFEAERQALTMMDHPNIARVLDAGTTDAGRPYFVMELVKGIPITDYCDQARLDTRQRLALFVDVCQAVQHAHQKGVIHRDLKPTNVLVTLHDDKPVPKVIDFGIAKAAGQVLTDKMLFTHYAQMLGTPLYMSPEQAQISGLDVDTRSDVYSLGVLLYELLTGTTPFDKQRLREAAYDEMRRIIREEEPPNPSTRLSSMGDRIASVSALRHTEPRKLSQLVHGELDWIVMKALEKERSRRYETANGLGRDIERYLRDEAVQACPPSPRYRFRKFARRHRMGLLTTAACFVALLVLVATLTVSNVRVARERNEKTAALREKEQALTAAEMQRQRAEENFRKARIAIRGVVDIASGSGDWAQVPAALRQAFLDRINRYYQSLVQEGSRDPSTRYETAVGYRAIGFLNGSPQEAEKYYRQAIEILDGLLTESPTVLEYRHQMAWTHVVLGRTLLATARPAEAKTAYERAIELYEQLLLEKPDNSDYDVELAAQCYPAWRILPDNATTRPTERLCQRGLQLLAKLDPSQAPFLRRTLGRMSLELGRTEEAEKLLREALVGFETCNAPEVEIRNGKATAYYYLIEAVARQGRTDEFGAIHKKQIADLPDDPDGRATLVAYSLTTANALTKAKRWDEAIQLLKEATAALPAKAAGEYDEAIRLPPDVDALHYGLGSVYARVGEWEKAAAAFQRSVELRPSDLTSLVKWAAACFYLDDQENYRRACRALLDQFRKTGNVQIADNVAKACALAPGFAGDPQQVIGLMDVAVDGPPDAWFEITKALVYYRAGRFGAAADIIIRSAPSKEIHRDALAFSILASVQHRLGRAEEARVALANARQIISTKMPKIEKGETFNDDWHDWLHAQILCREAEKLLTEAKAP